MWTHWQLRIAIAAAAVAACSSAGPPAAAPTGVEDLRVVLDPPRHGYQIHTHPHVVPAGRESYTCDIVRVDGNPGDRLVWIGGFESRTSPHTHHMNVKAGLFSFADAYLGAGAAASMLGHKLGQYDCGELGDLMETQGAQVVYPSQRPHQVGALPAGVAVPTVLPMVLVVEHHYINAGDHDVLVDGRVNFVTVPRADVKVVATGFFGTVEDVKLPAHSGRIVARTCAVAAPVTMVAISSHSHARGDCFTMNFYNGQASAVVDKPFFVNKDWESPPIMFFSPATPPPELMPQKLRAGDGVHWACHYDNPEAREVRTGPSASDEMCIFVGIGYPNALTVNDVEQFVAQPWTLTPEKLAQALVPCNPVTAASPWPKANEVLSGRPTACDAYAQTGGTEKRN